MRKELQHLLHEARLRLGLFGVGGEEGTTEAYKIVEQEVSLPLPQVWILQ